MTTTKTSITRKCKRCGNVKDINEFPKNKLKHLGHGHTCKPCSKAIIENYNKTERGVVKSMYQGQMSSSRYRKMPLPNYSFDDFFDWVMANGFKALYDEWAKKGHPKHLKPSADRINDYKPYTLDNIRLVTFCENHKKASQDKIKGINKKQLKPVIQMDSNGKILNEYYSIAEASRKTGLSAPSISNCCRGYKYKHVGGFKWAFKDNQ